MFAGSFEFVLVGACGGGTLLSLSEAADLLKTAFMVGRCSSRRYKIYVSIIIAFCCWLTHAHAHADAIDAVLKKIGDELSVPAVEIEKVSLIY